MKSTVFEYSLFFFKVLYRHAWKSFIILVAGLIFTIAIAIYADREESAKDKKELTLVCNEIRTKISIRLHSYALLLRSGTALFATGDTITRQDWQKFIERIKIQKNLPGIQGVGYSTVIAGSQLKQHISQIRHEGFSEYTVKPAGNRSVYTSIIFIEPFTDRNLRAFGYDMFSEPVRRKAMEQSRDSDMAILSGKVTLVQETNKDIQFGALMYVPVYSNTMPVNTIEQRRAAIKGWVYSPYRINDLMQGILGRWDMIQMDRIHLQVYEDSLSQKSLLYNSQYDDSVKNDNSPLRTVSMPVNFNGKKWILYFTQTHERASVSNKVVIIMVTGITISFLLFVLSLSLFNLRDKVHQIAGQLTAELRESEERFRILLNSTAEGIYGLDMKGNCTFSNKACLQLLGVTSHDQLFGKNMHDLIHHSHSDGSSFDVNDCRIYKAFLEGNGTHVDTEVLWRPDGTSFPAEYWSVPILINEKIDGAVVTFFDITERKQSMEKINEARNEAEKANHAKTEFLSRMSHELRTPMNSILGFAQLIEMGELNPAQRKGVSHILKSGKHLLGLINEVLDISRIEAGQISLSIEPVKLSNVILEILDITLPLATKLNLDVEFTDSPANQLFVLADNQRLKQVLLNLITNAVKYNCENGRVKIITEVQSTDSRGISWIRISVVDTGIGIKAEQISKLFFPFERIGAEKTETEGTGLGLAVVKKLMDVMGGNIGLESVPGEGSTFWIELPQAESVPQNNDRIEQLSGNKPDELSEPVISGTILYIEDNTSNIELVEQIVATQRTNIRLISNKYGEQAVSLAIKYNPDLILLDLDLPDIHGSRVLELLKGNAVTCSMPVVIISADAMHHQVEKLIEAGARKYLTKPLHVIDYLKVMDEYIGK
ncbi:MAG: CHASE domain-containing protein [Bacteroidota bacterium]